MSMNVGIFNTKRCFRLISENKTVGIMKPGHSFTIEPMISEGKIVSFFSNIFPFWEEGKGSARLPKMYVTLC